MKRYKPRVQFKIMTAYWWNPIFWIMVIIGPVMAGFKEIGRQYYEIGKSIIFEWNLN